jgi:hypothetical protein
VRQWSSHGPVSGNAFEQAQALPDVKATKKILKINQNLQEENEHYQKLKALAYSKCKNPLQRKYSKYKNPLERKTTAWSCEGKVTLSNVAFTVRRQIFLVFTLLVSTGFTTSISFL